MSAPGPDLAALDDLVRDPVRLAIAAALSAADGCDIRYLRALTGLAAEDLDGHLAALVDGGVIALEERRRRRRTETWVALRPRGEEVVHRHWAQLSTGRGRPARWRGPTTRR